MKNKYRYRNVSTEPDADKFQPAQLSLTPPQVALHVLGPPGGLSEDSQSSAFIHSGRIFFRSNNRFSAQLLAAFSAQLVDESTAFKNLKSIYMVFKKILHTHGIIPSCPLFIGCDHIPLEWDKITSVHSWLTLISKHLQINY